MVWHLGGAQTDVAELTAEDIDWKDRTVSYRRHKTGVPVVISFGTEAASVLELLPKIGPLFRRMARIKENHRAKTLIKRLKTLEIRGVSLHRYRYACFNADLEIGISPMRIPENPGLLIMPKCPKKFLVKHANDERTGHPNRRR
jgi:integrase